MPTTKPRISITLDEADVAVLDRFSAAAGKPRASFLSAMISAAVPQFARAAEVLELARDAPSDLVKGVVDDIEKATTGLLGVLSKSVDDAEAVINKASGKAAGKGSRSRGKVPAAQRRKRPGDPLLLTGGSK